MDYFHSVLLNRDKCHGCTNCLRRCPTEAIRVRHGKAKILKERCIDCGECVRVCQSHAKYVATDAFDILKNYKYTVALPAPSFYSQFRTDICVDAILTAFIKIGFDDVFEVARGAEYVSLATKDLLNSGNLKKPVISSACPAVLRLIRQRFPNLIDNVLNIISPMEAAAILARDEAKKKTGLSDDDIGVFFITPCPAKVTSIKAPLTLEKSYVSGAISAKDAYAKIRPIIETITDPLPLSKAAQGGLFWARSGGECKGSGVEDYISVDGIHNVIQVLEEIEYGKVNQADFVELSACISGCSGGPLNLANPFLASRRITLQAKKKDEEIPPVTGELDLSWKKNVEPAQIASLDDDFSAAMEKMQQMDEIYARLPNLDCGSCGAPTCKALAEDVVRGYGNENDCIFKMRERIYVLAQKLLDLTDSEKKDENV